MLIMKLILFLICGVVFPQNFAFEKPDLNSDDIVGVSQENLEEYITEAFLGFEYVILEGDEELDYPVMDPYKIEPFSCEYVDTSGRKKYKLKMFIKNSSIIKGLSKYYIYYVQVSAKDMKLSLRLGFFDLRIDAPYKLDGYFFNFLPLYGEGIIKLSSGFQMFNIVVDLETDRGYIKVEDVRVSREDYNANIKVTGFMDLSDKFSKAVVDEVLVPIVKQYIDKALTKFARNLVEKAIGGMTIEELFDLLDHFAKKKEMIDTK